MSKSIDLILGAVKSAGEAALRLHEENVALAARLAEAEALLLEAQTQLRDQPRGSTLDDRIDAFLAPDNASNRENERG